MGTDTIQTMKKNTWRYLREKGAFNRDGNPALNDAMWGAADGMAKIVNDVIPEMAGENLRYGEIANLNKMLTRSVNRIANNNLISLHSAMQLIRMDYKGFGMALALKTIDHPTFKMYLAQKMAKAQKRKVTNAEVNNAVAQIKLGIEDFDPALRTPGETTPIIERGATPENPLQYGEREIRPGYSGEIPLSEEPGNVIQNLGPGFPQGAKVTPTPGRAATLIDNKLKEGKGGVVYHDTY